MNGREFLCCGCDIWCARGTRDRSAPKQPMHALNAHKKGLQLLNTIEKIHGEGIVHRDIKPHNICVGDKGERDKIYIVDFGLSKFFTHTSFNLHLPIKIGLSPVGTARYASLWTHFGMSQSRRDDLESIGYILVYFLKGRLPWQGLPQSTKAEKWNSIAKSKEKTSYKNNDINNVDHISRPHNS